MRLFECGNCYNRNSGKAAMFTVYADKEVKFCPYCGSGNCLCEIKSEK